MTFSSFTSFGSLALNKNEYEKVRQVSSLEKVLHSSIDVIVSLTGLS